MKVSIHWICQKHEYWSTVVVMCLAGKKTRQTILIELKVLARKRKGGI